MIFLKWEEPVEPNGLITQYEVESLHTQTEGDFPSFLPSLLRSRL